MAGPVRVTFFFGQQQSGWSETWWYPAGIGTAFYSKVKTLAQARVNMLQTEHTLIAARIAEEGANRISRLVLGGQKTQLDINLGSITLPGRGMENGVAGNIEGRPDQVRAAMQIEVLKDGNRVGLRYLAGIPDDITQTEHPTLNRNFNLVWWNLFGEWRTRIVFDGWAIKTLDKGAGFPLIDVIGYRLREAAPSLMGLVLPAALPFPNTKGKKVALQGVRTYSKQFQAPNGTYVIDSVEEDIGLGQRTIWLRGSEGYDPSTFLTLGKARAVSHTFLNPTFLEPLRAGIHKRGKPFGSLVGRRPARR